MPSLRRQLNSGGRGPLGTYDKARSVPGTDPAEATNARNALEKGLSGIVM